MSDNSLAAGGHPDWLWRNGCMVPWETATIHVNAVGHASVSAVFEGIKAYRSQDGNYLSAFRLRDHLERLLQSARLARLRVDPTIDELEDACMELLAVNNRKEDTYLRPWIFPRGIIREQMVPADSPCEVVIDSWGFSSQLSSIKACSAGVSTWQRTDELVAPPRIKAFSNYHNGRFALMEAHRNGYDWPVMLNRNGKVSEGAASCIAIALNGRIVTPPISSGILDGLTRDSALALLVNLGYPVDVRDVDRSELYLADEIFFLGTAWEVLPVGRIDGMVVGSGQPGAIATALASEYERIVRGTTERMENWITKHEIAN